MRSLLLLSILALAACDKPSPTAVTNNTTTTTVATTAAATVGTTTTAADPNTDEVRQHMHEHWGLAVVVRDATIAATLDELPDVAGELADHKAPDALAAHREHIRAMRQAAEQAQKAPNTTEAAAAVASIARACGDCHVAAGVKPVLPSDDLPPDEDATKAHMLHRDFAARELWAGLVMPSDERWARGAQALNAKPLKKGDFFEDWEVTDALIQLDAKVYGMRDRVMAASTRDERVAVYAELITNCATCHGATDKGPVD